MVQSDVNTGIVRLMGTSTHARGVRPGCATPYCPKCQQQAGAVITGSPAPAGRQVRQIWPSGL